jgi:hypothetical protein
MLRYCNSLVRIYKTDISFSADIAAVNDSGLPGK